MNRRDLLRGVAGSGLSMLLPVSRLFAAPADYTGRFFVTLQAEGAWDVTGFCDPKMNQKGEPNITQWSTSQEIQTAGNIRYAPYANNAALFSKYANDMLVINGIDAQTNSHTTGVLHNWSGRNSAGYPSLTALFSAINAPDLPIAYLNYGGYAETSGLVRYTRLDNINSLLSILRPNTPPWDDTASFRGNARLQRILDAQQMRLARLRQQNTLLPRQKYAMDAYYDARQNGGGLEDFANEIPATEDLQPTIQVNTDVNSRLLQQIQIAMLAFKSGAACSADLTLNGFDTHTNHDELHEPLFAHLADAIDFFWTYAESQGVAERITLLIGSDFSRTPYYNSSNGKDHWPISSVILMEKDAVWGNRVVGATDEGQNPYAINPSTLQIDETNGSIIYPKHWHKALRDYLGLGDSRLSLPFSFDNTEDFDFFNTSLRTV